MIQDKRKKALTHKVLADRVKGSNVGNKPIFFCPIIAHLFIGGNYYEKKNEFSNRKYFNRLDSQLVTVDSKIVYFYWFSSVSVLQV